MNAEELIRLLELKPLPVEGGYYRPTYQCSDSVSQNALPPRYTTDKPIASAIYFLLTDDMKSRLHSLPTDEIWHYYAGDAVELYSFSRGGEDVWSGILGLDFVAGHRPQIVVQHSRWFGARLAPGGKWALLGCTMAPAYTDSDFSLPTPAEVERLAKQQPHLDSLIRALAAESKETEQ